MLKKKWKKRNLVIGFLIVIAAVTIGICISNPKFVFMEIDTVKSEEFPKNRQEAVGEITSNVNIRQTIKCKEDVFTGFQLLFATYGRQNTCHLTVVLTDTSADQVMEVWNVDAANLTDNEYYPFSLTEPLQNVRDREFQISIFSEDASEGNAVTLWKNSDTSYQDGNLYQNDIETTGNLGVILEYQGEKISYRNTKNVINLMIYLCILSAIVYWVILGFVKLIKQRKNVLKFLRKYKKNIGIHLGCVIVLFLLSLAIEAGYSRFVIQNKNSMGTYFNWCRWLFILSVLSVIYSFVLYYKNYLKKIETVFLLSLLILGSMFAIVQPVTTLVSWDDEIHYQNVINTSYLTKYKYTEADNRMITRVYPVTFSFSEAKEQKKDINTIYDGDIIREENYKNYNIFYNSVGYLPASLVHMLLRNLPVPFTYLFVLGRLANVVVYAFVVSLAMKKLQWGKMMMGAIALFPTCVFLASNYSYDYWVTAFVMLGFGYLFGELQQPHKKIEPKDMILMLVSFFIGMGPKAIYFPLILLCFALKKEKFSSERQCKYFRIAVIGTTVVILATFMLPFISQGPGVGDIRGGSDINATEQVKFILTHPFQYTKILLNFLFGTYLRIENSGEYTNLIAYLGKSSFSIISMAVLIFTIFFDRRKEERNILNLKFRGSVWILAFATVSLVATALYISFTPVGLGTINGCQWRYLIPVLFPVVYCFGSNFITKKASVMLNEKKINILCMGVSFFILAASIWEVCVQKYY